MRKFIVFLFIVLCSINGLAEEISFYRTNFPKADSKVKLEKVIDAEVTEKNAKNKFVIMAYRGICKTMMAEYVSNPLSKLSWFKEGKKLLEKAIKLNKNIETVHLRLMVQCKAPSFLGYNKNKEADKKYLLKNLEKSSVSDSIKKQILQNLISTKELEEFQDLAKKYGAL